MKTAVKYGVLVGIGSFFWIMLEYWLGYRTGRFNVHLTTSLFSWIVLLGGIVALVYGERTRRGREYSFKKAWYASLVLSLVAGVIMVFGQYLYLGVIDKNYLRRAQTWGTYIQVVDGVDLEEAKANTADGAWRRNMHVRALGQIPQYLLWGGIFGAGASAVITRKRK